MKKINVIYMASGRGRRFGSNKLLYEYRGLKLYRHGLSAMLDVREKLKRDIEINIIVVSAYDEILSYARSQGLTCIKNDEADEGISSGIRLGTACDEADYYMFLPADMPNINAESIIRLCMKTLSSEPYSLFAPADMNNVAGSPCIFDKKYKAELLALRGDKGGKSIFNKYPEAQLLMQIEPTSNELLDIDHKSDL